MRKAAKEVLKELEKTRKEFWNISNEVGQLLYLIIQDRAYKKVLEIGTSNGYSGIWIASALEKTGGTLYTIESNFKKRFPLSQQNFKKARLKNVEQILGHAPEVIPKTPRSFDMAFFDATKYEHIDYFNAIESRIKKGGLIVTDNVCSHGEVLEKYIQSVQKNRAFKSVVLDIDQGLMLSFKL